MDPRKPIAVLAAFAIALAAFGGGLLAGRVDAEREFLAVDGSPTGTGLGAIRDAYQKILSTSVDPPSEAALTKAAIKAMVKLLKDEGDPYALFYTPEGYRSFQELTTGEFSGIGVWLKQRGKNVVVVSVLPDSPALEGGLERGDVIREVNGEPLTELTIDEVVGSIKGPEGTEVDLLVERDGRDLSFTLKRATLVLPNLRARMVGEFGYIQLFGFANGAANQVRARVQSLVDQGAKGIVFDLRDNGGGLFSEGVDVASVFIEDGAIVSYEERSNDPVTYEAEGDAFEDLPLVVLVNGGTASASEIVAGALQDRDRAVLIGTQTYGKGSVQEVVPLLDASALKLTIGAYLTPDGRQINGTGIEPDVIVKAKDLTEERREQKLRAFEILRGIALSQTSG